MGYSATTSAFGRRGVTRAQISAELAVRAARREGPARAGQGAEYGVGAGVGAVHKWTALRMLSEIREGLGVSDRALGVLSALLSFHPETALTLEGDGLVVFPSNKALGLRCNGMSEPTLRRHLSALVEAGLIIRRDSPNGKRYARRAGEGEGVAQAFGFDLAPVAARAGEFEARLEALRAERLRLRLLKERVTLLRRDLTKRLAFALDEGLAGPWEGLRRGFLGLCAPLRSLRGCAQAQALTTELERLQEKVTQALGAALAESRDKARPQAQNPNGDGAQTERRISESTPEQVLDSDPASKEEGPNRAAFPRPDARPAQAPTPQAGTPADESPAQGRAGPGGAPSPKPLPLGLVLEACPDIADYDFAGGGTRDWTGFVALAAGVRPMLGISPDAWREAVETLGAQGAACALAFILQRCEHSSEAVRHVGPDGRLALAVNGAPAIRSPGGYLRALTQKAGQEPFSLWSAILGQLARRAKTGGETRREISAKTGGEMSGKTRGAASGTTRAGTQDAATAGGGAREAF